MGCSASCKECHGEEYLAPAVGDVVKLDEDEEDDENPAELYKERICCVIQFCSGAGA